MPYRDRVPGRGAARALLLGVALLLSACGGDKPESGSTSIRIDEDAAEGSGGGPTGDTGGSGGGITAIDAARGTGVLPADSRGPTAYDLARARADRTGPRTEQREAAADEGATSNAADAMPVVDDATAPAPPAN